MLAATIIVLSALSVVGIVLTAPSARAGSDDSAAMARQDIHEWIDWEVRVLLGSEFRAVAEYPLPGPGPELVADHAILDADDRLVAIINTTRSKSEAMKAFAGRNRVGHFDLLEGFDQDALLDMLGGIAEDRSIVPGS